MNCFIVDDEEHAINNLVYCVNKTPSLHLIGSTMNPLKALETLNSQKIDLMFLDIQMPELSGLDLIKAINGRSKIILTTAYSQFALDGFNLDVVDYLLKPIALPRFLQAIQKVQNIFPANAIENTLSTDDFFLVKTEVKGKFVKINFDDIDYVESLKNYVAIHFDKKKILALQSLKEIDDRLPKNKFMRVHRSYIVALNKITNIEGNHVKLQNVNAEILLGETYKNDFIERLKGTII